MAHLENHHVNDYVNPRIVPSVSEDTIRDLEATNEALAAELETSKATIKKLSLDILTLRHLVSYIFPEFSK